MRPGAVLKTSFLGIPVAISRLLSDGVVVGEKEKCGQFRMAF